MLMHGQCRSKGITFWLPQRHAMPHRVMRSANLLFLRLAQMASHPQLQYGLIQQSFHPIERLDYSAERPIAFLEPQGCS